MNIDSVYSVIMVASVFGFIVKNTHGEHAFDIVVLDHHLESWDVIGYMSLSYLFRTNGSLKSGRYISVVPRLMAIPFIRDLQSAAKLSEHLR